MLTHAHFFDLGNRDWVLSAASLHLTISGIIVVANKYSTAYAKSQEQGMGYGIMLLESANGSKGKVYPKLVSF